MNWVHVDNLVTAHQLAAEGLTASRNGISVSRGASLRSKPGSDESLSLRFSFSEIVHAAPLVSVFPLQSGQVYFINDGVSVNVFEWLSPLVSLVFKSSRNTRCLKTWFSCGSTVSLSL